MMSPTERPGDFRARVPRVRPAIVALATATVLCWGLFGCNEAAAPCFPKRANHFLYDEAGWLDRDAATRIERALRELYDRDQLQFVVVVTEDLCGKSPAQYANELGDAWGVGSANEDNGVVLVVVPKRPGRRGHIFLAPGRGIQDRLPDIRAKRITRDLMVPRFKNGDHAGGILAGIAAVAQALGYAPPAAAAGVAPGKPAAGGGAKPPHRRARKGRHRRRSGSPPFLFFLLPFLVGVVLGGLARGASSRRRKVGLFALAPVLGAGLSTGVATMTSGDDIDLGAAIALSGALAAFAFLFGMAPGGGTRSGPVVLGGGSSSSGGGGGGIGWGGGGFNGGGAGSDW